MTESIDESAVSEDSSGVDAPSDVSKPSWKRWRARARRSLGIVAVALLVGAAAGWAVARVIAPPQQGVEQEAFSTVAVAQGEVGSSMQLDAVAEWGTNPVALNSASGTVTSVDIKRGDQVEIGQRLYTVDLRPVVAAQGAIPAYGQISPGDKGPQVRQLQQLMADLGFWTREMSSQYTPQLATAVREWQKSAGYPADAIVRAGDIVWVPTLPARMSLDETLIAPGRIVTAGAGELIGFGDAPSFTIPMQLAQTRFAPTGTRVVVEPPGGGEWEAVVGAVEADPQNSETMNATITAPDGGPVCGESCDQIGAVGQILLSSAIVTVPVQSGLVVPTSAITTAADGSAFVTDVEGARHTITVGQSARGMAIIEGVEQGLIVRIPAGS